MDSMRRAWLFSFTSSSSSSNLPIIRLGSEHDDSLRNSCFLLGSSGEHGPVISTLEFDDDEFDLSLSEARISNHFLPPLPLLGFSDLPLLLVALFLLLDRFEDDDLDEDDFSERFVGVVAESDELKSDMLNRSCCFCLNLLKVSFTASVSSISDFWPCWLIGVDVDSIVVVLLLNDDAF